MSFNPRRYLGVLRVSAVSFSNSIHRRAAEYAEVAQRINSNYDTIQKNK